MSENEKRILKINPELFSLSGGNNTTRKQQKDRAQQKLKIKTIEPKRKTDTLKRKSILNMIRKQQEEKYKKMIEENKDRTEKHSTESDEVDTSIFKEATSFLNHIKENVSTSQNHNHNHTVKNTAGSPAFNTPIIQSAPGFLKPVFQRQLTKPEWGCLKNGTLPTYRNYVNKTRTNQFPIKISGGSPPSQLRPPQASIPVANQQTSAGASTNQQIPTSPQQEESKRVQNMERAEIAKKVKEEIMGQQLQKMKPQKIMKQKKTRKRTYKVGKSKVAPRIGVLVSNKTIRNKVTTQSQLLKQTPLEDVKRFLVKHGIIKIGSIAPTDVLYKMYESAFMMCGEIYNHNKDTLLHNFINGDKF
jgi:hypothetical protein